MQKAEPCRQQYLNQILPVLCILNMINIDLLPELIMKSFTPSFRLQAVHSNVLELTTHYLTYN